MITTDDCLDVIVVGAGQAGLARASHLRRHQPAVPRRRRRSGARPRLAHAAGTRCGCSPPRSTTGCPGMAFPAPADSYPTKDEVADYLAAYAAAVRAAGAAGLRGAPAGAAATAVRVHTTQGTLRARQVVVATGPFQDPGRARARRRASGPRSSSCTARRTATPPTLPDRDRCWSSAAATPGCRSPHELAADPRGHAGGRDTDRPAAPADPRPRPVLVADPFGVLTGARPTPGSRAGCGPGATSSSARR